MPELPEVELFGRYFQRYALHQRIAAVRVLDDRILGDISTARFKKRIRGQSFTSIMRHGKHLFASLGAEWLHLHFGMSGDLAYYADENEQPRFARTVFDFENGAHLAFEDMRLFGVLDLTPSPDEFISAHGLGPDPLGEDFTLRSFRDLLSPRRGAIKSLLMSQEIIAGIGNLYADEALYQSSIHPRRPVDELTPVEVRTLFQSIRRILTSTIVRKAASRDYPAHWLIPHRESGDRCPKCGGEIERSVVFGRTTYFCGRHQR